MPGAHSQCQVPTASAQCSHSLLVPTLSSQCPVSAQCPVPHSQFPVPTRSVPVPTVSASAHTVSASAHTVSASAHTVSAHSQCQCPHGQCPVPTRSVPRVRSVRARPEHCNTYCMQTETPHLLVFVVQVSGLCSVYPFRLQPLCVSPKPVWKRGGKTVKPPTKEASLCTPHQHVPTDGDIVFTRR